MTKILCPCVECIHNGKRNVCNADKVELKWRNMATVNEGRVDMWICKQYELSEFAKRIDKEFVDNLERIEKKYAEPQANEEQE